MNYFTKAYNATQSQSPMQAAETLAALYVEIQSALVDAVNTDQFDTVTELATSLRNVVTLAKQNNINRNMMNHVALLTPFRG